MIANAILYAGYTATVVILSLIGMFLVEAWASEFMAAIPPMLLLLLAWPNGRPMYRRRPREDENSEDTLHLQPDDEL